MVEHTTTNIATGVVLDLSTWDWIFCMWPDSWLLVVPINAAALTALGPKAALGFAIPNK